MLDRFGKRQLDARDRVSPICLAYASSRRSTRREEIDGETIAFGWKDHHQLLVGKKSECIPPVTSIEKTIHKTPEPHADPGSREAILMTGLLLLSGYSNGEE